MNPHVLLLSHGSRDLSSIEEMGRLAQTYQARHPDWKIHHAFLELADPSFISVVEKIASHSEKIQVLPLFLFEGVHVTQDIPALVQKARLKFPRVTFQLARPFGMDPLVTDLLWERLCSIGFDPTRTPSRILMVGHGTSDGKANEDFLNLASLFQKRHSLSAMEASFIGMGKPLWEESWSAFSNLEPGILWILPYFLFQGHFAGKILEKINRFRVENPGWKVQLAPPLSGSELFFKILDARLDAL